MWGMITVEDFEAAAQRIKQASRLSPEQLLRLYALYKQATAGDVQGERPGALDFKGRAKYDAWAAAKGLSPEAARSAYVELVDELMPAS